MTRPEEDLSTIDTVDQTDGEDAAAGKGAELLKSSRNYITRRSQSTPSTPSPRTPNTPQRRRLNQSPHSTSTPTTTSSHSPHIPIRTDIFTTPIDHIISTNSDYGSITSSMGRPRGRSRARGRGRGRGSLSRHGSPAIHRGGRSIGGGAGSGGIGGVGGYNGVGYGYFDDGKPREERSYKEFFPDLDLGASMKIVVVSIPDNIQDKMEVDEGENGEVEDKTAIADNDEVEEENDGSEVVKEKEDEPIPSTPIYNESVSDEENGAEGSRLGRPNGYCDADGIGIVTPPSDHDSETQKENRSTSKEIPSNGLMSPPSKEAPKTESSPASSPSSSPSPSSGLSPPSAQQDDKMDATDSDHANLGNGYTSVMSPRKQPPQKIELPSKTEQADMLVSSSKSTPLSTASPSSDEHDTTVATVHVSTPAPEARMLRKNPVRTPASALENPFQALSIRSRRVRVVDNGRKSSHDVLMSKVPLSSLPRPSFRRVEWTSDDEVARQTFRRPENHYIRYSEPTESELKETCEYDMDEQDEAYLKFLNADRRKDDLGEISRELFELVMDQLEKEWFDLVKNLPKPAKEPLPPEDSVCAICDDGECENSNAIVFCDGCNLAVHQDCYGIPYIPEGQWLCRKCMVSPENPVSCIFCPNEGGAFKLTTANKWGHLLCALWIPETGVSNQIYMEPIDCVEKIPKSRWSLTCYVCKKKNFGACIQCLQGSCYTAFHVTCARKAKLHMKMRHAKDGVKMEAFCDKHTPKDYKEQVDVMSTLATAQAFYENLQNPRLYNASDIESDEEEEYRPSSEEDGDDEANYSDSESASSPPPRKKQRHSHHHKSHKRSSSLLAAKGPIMASRSSKAARAHQHAYTAGAPIVPAILLDKLLQLDGIKSVGIKKKSILVAAVCKYWSLKRESRRGAPLLKRLHLEPWTASASAHKQTQAEKENRYRAMKNLRSDLEIVRMLSDKVKRREKLKLTILREQKRYVEILLYPLGYILGPTLDRLKDLDKQGYFAHPVTEEIAPDYFKFITQSMDFSTMSEKISSHIYRNFDEFEVDANLIYSNCMLYNKSETPYYKSAQKQQKVAFALLATSRKRIELMHIDPESGLVNIELNPEIFQFNLNYIQSPEEIEQARRSDEQASRRAQEVQARAEAVAAAAEKAAQRAAQRAARPPIPPSPAMPRRTTRSMDIPAPQPRTEISEPSEHEIEQLNSSPGFRRPRQKKPNDVSKVPKGWAYITDEEESPVDGESGVEIGGRILRKRLSPPPLPLLLPPPPPQTLPAPPPVARKIKFSIPEVKQEPRHSHKKRIVSRPESPVDESQEQKRVRVASEFLPDLPAGSIVWARVVGFPAHPAQIVDLEDDEVSENVIEMRKSDSQILVEFFEVAEKDRWGWVYRKDITLVGGNDVDKSMLERAKRGNTKRYREVVKGYEHVCMLLGIDPFRLNVIIRRPSEAVMG